MLRRKDAYFGLHLDLHPAEWETDYGVEMTEENIGAFLDRVKLDYITYDCKGHVGFCNYPTKIGVCAGNLQSDVLEVLRHATAKREIPLGIHFSGLIDNVQTELNPQYAAMDDKGATVPSRTSVFGSYVDEVMLPQLREIIDRYGIDGVWIDGECWGAVLDYSPAAKAAWKELKGTPAPVDRDDPQWLEWTDFHRENFKRYTKHWVSSLHEEYPELDICSNWAFITQMPVPVCAPVHMISGDVVPKFARERLRMETRYLQHSGMPWELMLWGGGWSEEETNKLPKSVIQLQQEMAPILVHGGSGCVYFNPTRSGLIPEDTADTIDQLGAFCYERRDLCQGSTPIPQVAVIFPSSSYLRHSEMVYGMWDATPDDVDGVLEAMTRSQYSCCVLDENMLPSKLNQYHYVVLPECDYLPPETIALLKGYVKEGGNLFVCGQQASAMFEEELGVRLPEAQQTKTRLLIGNREIIAHGLWATPELHGAQVLLQRLEAPSTDGELTHPETQSMQQRVPAVTINSFGKGKIAGIYGNLPMLYFKTHYRYFLEVFDMVARELFAPDVLVDAPYPVEVSLRNTADGNVCAHLISTCGSPDFDRNRFIDYIPKLDGITLKIRAPRPERVTFQPDGQELAFSYSDGWVTIRDISLHIHGAVVLH